MCGKSLPPTSNLINHHVPHYLMAISGGHTMSAWPLGCIQWTEWMDRKLPCCFGGNGSPATQRPDMMRQPAMSGIPTRKHGCFKMIMTLSYTTTDDPDCFGKDTSILGRLEIRMCSSAVRVIIPGGDLRFGFPTSDDTNLSRCWS